MDIALRWGQTQEYVQEYSIQVTRPVYPEMYFQCLTILSDTCVAVGCHFYLYEVGQSQGLAIFRIKSYSQDSGCKCMDDTRRYLGQRCSDCSPGLKIRI